MGVGEGDDMDGREKDGKRNRSGRKKERETGMGERKIARQEQEREIGRETGVGERERERGEREGVTGEKEKKLQTQKNSWKFIFSYFTPQNGAKHDSGL